MKLSKEWLNVLELSYGSLTLEWMNSDEAANYLRIPIGTLRNKTSVGEIPYAKLGRSNRYFRDDLRNLLFSQKKGGSDGN